MVSWPIYMLDCKETDDEWDTYESYLHAGVAYIKRQAAEVGTSAAIPVATPGGGRPNTEARGPSYQPPPREEPKDWSPLSVG
jgi:hypothetical protein